LKPLLSIQYLRAFAALAVAVFHACQWADLNFDIGAGGVDIFFVISGFLMWAITQEPSLTPAAFLWRRVTRVAPLYWIATLALAGLAVAAPALIEQVAPVPSHIVLSLLFIPHLDPAGLAFPLLPPGWTLNYEAILYLIFTLALFGPRRWRLAIVLTLLSAIPVMGLLITPLFTLFANPLMFEFVAGVVMARVMAKGARLSLGMGWSFIALGLTSFAMLRLLGIHSDLGRWYLWGLPAVGMVIGAISIEARGGLPKSAIFRRIGDASYAIYLCHWPIVAITAKLMDAIHYPWIFIPLTVLEATGVGLVIHYALEKPLLRLTRGGGGKPAFSAP
jgi:exopolysaccharide production protein ExoZ